MNTIDAVGHFRRGFAILLTTAVVSTAGITAAKAQDAPESDQSQVDLIEQITGTDALVDVVPGEASEHVTVPEAADEPVVLEADGVSVIFEQPGTSQAEAAIGENGTISFVDEGSTFNTHVQVLESPDSAVLSEGVRSLIEIQDASAPTEFVYPVAMDEGTTLEVQADGSVHGNRGDELVLIIPAPWALDAAGAVVPTWYEVRGDALVQHVTFTAANSFPVIADPVWFVPLIVAGARIVGQVAISAATRTAAIQTTLAVAKREILRLSATRWAHIMDPKHNWSRLATTRDQVADLMSRAVTNGTAFRGSNHFDYVWTHRGQTIVVRTSLDGHISNGWIRP